MSQSSRSSAAATATHSAINFGEARLVSLESASYIELGKPDADPLRCAFCPKTTAHEHEFAGRVKVDPRAAKLFVSFVTSAVKDRKVTPRLEVIPVVALKEKKAGPPVSKVYPMLSTSREETASLFKKWLHRMVLRSAASSSSSSSAAAGSEIMAVKDISEDEVVLVRVTTKEEGGQEEARRQQGLKSCNTCKEDAFATVEELARHFGEDHGLRVQVKRVSKPSSPGQKRQEWSDPASSSSSSGSKRVPNWVCPVCDVDFEEDELRMAHVNEVHATKGESDYQCTLCLQRFKSRLVYKQHVRTHKKDKVRRFPCHLCAKSFLKALHLRNHLQIHLGMKPHTCALCDKKYTSSSSLKSHLVHAHAKGEKPTCPDCRKTFYSRTQLNKHVLQQHRQDARLSCPHCPHAYLRRDNLQAHIRACHLAGDDERPVCRLCGGQFMSRASLADHLLGSHGILPWNAVSSASSSADIEKDLTGHLKCRICEHTFLPAEMESHLRFSHGVTPIRPGAISDFSISEAAEALLRTLTPQPDYLLRCLTPLPMETLDDFITQ